MKSAEKMRRSLLVVLSLAVAMLFVPYVVINLSAGTLVGALSSIPGLSSSASAATYTFGINGVQFALSGGIVFSFLGDAMSLIPFKTLILTALFCIALFSPCILNLVSLFLSIFSESKNVKRAVIVLQSVCLALNLFIMVEVIDTVSTVNNVALFRFGAGAALAPAANLASIVFAIVWYSRASRPEVVEKLREKNGSLVCLAGEYAGTVIPLGRSEELTIGRDGAFCNIVLSGEKISRKHCAVRFDSDKLAYVVTDLSSNGTYIKGGMRLIKNQPTPVACGSTLVLGNEDNLFRLQ